MWLIFLNIFSFHVFAQLEVDKDVFEINNVVTNATNSAVGCVEKRDPPKKIELSGDSKQYHKKVEISSPGKKTMEKYKGVEISVLNKEDADKLFLELSKIDYMQFDYLHDGCALRAQEFALIAKENGYELGKAMLSHKDGAGLFPKEWINNSEAPVPEGFFGWRYHVAPVVLVKDKDGKIEPYVMDIGVAGKLKKLKEWSKDMEPNEKRVRLEVTDRSHIFPNSRVRDLENSWIDGQLEDQKLIRELGIDEFLFRREQGWL